VVDATGTVALLKVPLGAYDHPRASPDGNQVVFVTDEGKDANGSIYDLSGGGTPTPHVWRQKSISCLGPGRATREAL